MGINIETLEAVIFDYGNTLIPFGPEQVEHERVELRRTLGEMYGDCDADALNAVRDRQLMAPYRSGLVENEISVICAELVEEIYGRSPTSSELDQLMETRYRLFLTLTSLPEGVRPLLEGVGQRYRLAVVSNYPCGRSIRDSIAAIGIGDLFETVVVSGDMGYVKPHPSPFEEVLSRLDLAPERCVYVGDNWLADIQGAKGIGMQAVYTTQYKPYESFPPTAGGHQPDATIGHLSELEDLLL